MKVVLAIGCMANRQFIILYYAQDISDSDL